ncbi:hypothetical protein IPG36_06285 [bacterium]|nr:MAG: hypothetical protein IPG36_06285 [bacterium]
MTTLLQIPPPWAPLGSRPMKIVFIAGPYIGDGKIETIEANRLSCMYGNRSA